MAKKPLNGEVRGPDEDEYEEVDQEKNLGGAPEHVPTQKQRDNVEVLAGRGVKQRAIAVMLDISYPTLRKHYAKELVLGDAKVQTLLGEAGLTMALGRPAEYFPPGHVHAGKLAKAEMLPDKSLLIFLLKTRLGLIERHDITLTGDGRLADDAEFNTAGLTNSERVSRLAGILDAARARGVRRPIERPMPVGTVQREPAGSSDKKRG